MSESGLSASQRLDFKTLPWCLRKLELHSVYPLSLESPTEGWEKIFAVTGEQLEEDHIKEDAWKARYRPWSKVPVRDGEVGAARRLQARQSTRSGVINKEPHCSHFVFHICVNVFERGLISL